MSAAERLAECRQILGGQRDKFAASWNDSATAKDRALLLRLGGANGSEVVRYQAFDWYGLPVVLRANIKAALLRFRSWSDRVAL